MPLESQDQVDVLNHYRMKTQYLNESSYYSVSHNEKFMISIFS